MKKSPENTLVVQHVKVKQVCFDEHRVYFELLDGRAVGVPLEWFSRLHKAPVAQKNKRWECLPFKNERMLRGETSNILMRIKAGPPGSWNYKTLDTSVKPLKGAFSSTLDSHF